MPLLIYGATLIFLLTVYLSYHFFANVTPQLSHIHGGWFIPPVSAILVTNALLLYPPNEMFFAISLIYFGMGIMLFLFMAILFLRLVNHELLPPELAPTNFILNCRLSIHIPSRRLAFWLIEFINCPDPLNLVMGFWTLGFYRKRNALFEIHEEGISFLPRMVELRVPNCCLGTNCSITACRTFQTSVFYTVRTFNVHMDRGLCKNN